jgi:hypothetical protein
MEGGREGMADAGSRPTHSASLDRYDATEVRGVLLCGAAVHGLHARPQAIAARGAPDAMMPGHALVLANRPA